MALEAIKRLEKGTRVARRARRNGLVPAVLYGKGVDPVCLYVSLKELRQEHFNVGHVLDLAIQGSLVKAIIKDVQIEPATGAVLHLDFQALSAGSTVTVTVPVVITGEPVGVKKGGILEFITREVELEIPSDRLFEQIVVDVSNLDLGDIIHVRDLPIPEGVKVLEDPDEVVVTIAEQEVEEVAAEAETVSEPEVISKGKKEEEE
ncbi:50S ribosomal protein L25 [Coprothermobacteraceae bacterium]|nr:50S ribosomal protein L25 [Coprothermobacteraceae bacterium]